MDRQRVVIAGLGDTGVLTAIRLARRFDVVGISVKPGLVSGQELGVRVARPDDWARDYWIEFGRFRGLDRVRTVHGVLTGVDLAARTVHVDRVGAAAVEPYDVLVIATGVTNDSGGDRSGRPPMMLGGNCIRCTTGWPVRSRSQSSVVVPPR